LTFSYSRTKIHRQKGEEVVKGRGWEIGATPPDVGVSKKKIKKKTLLVSKKKIFFSKNMG